MHVYIHAYIHICSLTQSVVYLPDMNGQPMIVVTVPGKVQADKILDIMNETLRQVLKCVCVCVV